MSRAESALLSIDPDIWDHWTAKGRQQNVHSLRVFTFMDRKGLDFQRTGGAGSTRTPKSPANLIKRTQILYWSTGYSSHLKLPFCRISSLILLLLADKLLFSFVHMIEPNCAFGAGKKMERRMCMSPALAYMHRTSISFPVSEIRVSFTPSAPFQRVCWVEILSWPG